MLQREKRFLLHDARIGMFGPAGLGALEANRLNK